MINRQLRKAKGKKEAVRARIGKRYRKERRVQFERDGKIHKEWVIEIVGGILTK